MDYAQRYPNETSAIEAFRLALQEEGTNSIVALLDTTNGIAVVQLIGNSREKELQPVLKSLLPDSKKPAAIRKAAVQALARTKDGANYLIELAREGKLAQELSFTASSEFNVAPWPEVKRAALEVLPLPQAVNAEPLPPLAELVKRPGNAERGRAIFESPTAACSSCHVVNGKGTDVGPQLSEIGTKLGKDALYESILDPSSGISFGFEAWSIELKNGDELFGIVTSETAEELTVKAQTGVISKVKKTEIARRQKLSSSLMPTGLQLTMSAQDLIDLVEYLASLKKAAP
jgi:putative heme-binding domain-containing protein